MFRLDRLRLPAWIVAGLGLALVGWLAWAGDGGGPGAGGDVGPEGTATPSRAPGLLTASRRDPVGEAPGAPDAVAKDRREKAQAPGGAGAEASPPRRVALRVTDAAGRPIARATVRVRILDANRSRSTGGSTRSDGRAEFDLPQGRVVSLEVDAPAAGGARRLLTSEDPAGLDLSAIGEVQAEDLLMLPIRTVDSSGLPRPAERILYRPREEGEVVNGWWGTTSDGDGWGLVGPFAVGARVEVRAGPRGLSRTDVLEPTGWQAVHVDGRVVEIVVDEVPRLRLVFPDVRRNARLWITVLDAENGKALFPAAEHRTGVTPWTAPALTQLARLEVLVRDEARGRVARLHDVVPAYEALEVGLEPGVALSDREDVIVRVR